MSVEIIGGPEPRPVVIADYTDAWPRRYEQERERLSGALGARALRIEHIGSTSVPGLAAKPIVDILVVVADADDEDAFRDPLIDAGYILRVREPGHRMFRTDPRDVHVHVYGEGAQDIDDYLVFRDWLRTHPEDRARYEAVKRELSRRTWADMQDYADAKTDIVEDIKARAYAARDETGGTGIG